MRPNRRDVRRSVDTGIALAVESAGLVTPRDGDAMMFVRAPELAAIVFLTWITRGFAG